MPEDIMMVGPGGVEPPTSRFLQMLERQTLVTKPYVRASLQPGALPQLSYGPFLSFLFHIYFVFVDFFNFSVSKSCFLIILDQLWGFVRTEVHFYSFLLM